MARIEVEPLSWDAIDAADWDDMVRASGGSYQAAYAKLAPWRRFQRMSGARVSLLELRWEGLAIGVCVLSQKGGVARIRERIMLLPEHEDLWPEAMAAILAHVGPGRYSYGRSTSIAPAREAQIARLPGVTIASTSPYLIQAVDFGAFDDWDHYWTGLKGNIRRNLRRASEEYALDLQCQRGNAILGSLPAFALAIARQKHRKGALRATLADARAIAMTATGMGHSARLLRATSGSDNLAWQFHVSFGRDDYYVAGAARRLQPSPAWWLTVKALQDAWQRDPDRRVVLGPFYPHLHDETLGGGLLQWRKWCRAQDFPACVVEFDYAA